MTKRIVIILLLALTQVFPAMAYRDADAPAPPREIITIIEYGDMVLEQDAWRVVGSTQYDGFATTSWENSELGAVTHIVYVHFPAGITDERMEKSFDASFFDTLFANYQDTELVQTCETSVGSLHEFTTMWSGDDYTSRIWITGADPKRVWGVQMIFPVTNTGALDDYAARFFPGSVSCGG